MKNSVDSKACMSRPNRVSRHEDGPMEIKSEEWKENGLKKNEESLRELWDTVKWSNVHIMEVLERDERNRRREYLKK